MTDLPPQSVSKQDMAGRDLSQESDGLLKLPEDFARAKRNVLFWTVVTFLLSLGSVEPSKHIEVTGFIRNFHFEQSFLITSSVVVMVFMLVGFLRAAARLRHVNLQAVYGASAAELQETIKETAQHLKNWSKHYVFPDDELAGLKQNLLSEYSRAFKELASARQIIGDHHDRVARAHLAAQGKVQDLLDKGKFSIEDLGKLQGSLNEVPRLGDRAARFESEDPQRTAVFSLNPQEFQEKIDKIISKNDPELPKNVQDTFSGLSNWSASITRWEKALFFIYDFWLVWLAVFLASAAAVMRLFYSDILNDLLKIVGWLPMGG